MSKLVTLRRRRAAFKGLLSPILKELEETDEDDFQVSKLKVQLALVEDYFKRFMEVEDEIIAEMAIITKRDGKEDDFTDEEETVSDSMKAFQEMYVKTKSEILRIIDELEDEKKEDEEVKVVQTPVKLPKLQLPTFDGTLTQYLQFKNEFTSTIGIDKNLSSVDCFRFLKSALIGEAKRIVDNLEVSAANYKKAWDALDERYGDQSLIFRSHIEAILKLNVVQKDSGHELHSLIDQAQSHLRSLKSLGTSDQILGNLLIAVVLEKLDVTTRIKWEESNGKEISSWKNFVSFLEKRAITLDKIKNVKPSAKVTHESKSGKGTKNTLLVPPKRESACKKCGSTSHSIAQCPSLVALTVNEREGEIKRLNLCIKCLKSNHQFKRCKAVCDKCSKRHHVLLHPETVTPQNSPVSTALVSAKLFEEEPAILASVIVHIVDDNQTVLPCRALLDCGSTNHYVSEQFIQGLNVQRSECNSDIGGIADTSTNSKGCCLLKFKSRYNNEEYQITANILPKVTAAYPPTPLPSKDWNIPEGLQLADPLFHKPQKVNLLIGAGLFWHMLLPRQFSLGPELPVLHETKLGWIVVGPTKSKAPSRALSSVQRSKADEELQKLVQRFWDVDTLHPKELQMKPQDQACEDHYTTTTRRDRTGRYSVTLPFRTSPNALGNSLDIAMRRFVNLERKLNREPSLKSQYSAFIKEYQELGHLEVVHDFDPSVPHYFMPHHCVLKPSSSSTKLRVVFDASCKTSNGVSLNDILYAGPKIQDDLMLLLLKFRIYPYVVTADIQKMYRQILVSKPDDNYQLILWRFNESEQPKVLRLRTVTYGTAPGAFLAIRTLHQLANDEIQNYPIGARILKNHFYVDDAMFGSESVEDLKESLGQLHAILNKGGFKLSKHCSNAKQVLEEIPPEAREKFLSIDDRDVIKTLGLIWQPDVDEFRYTYSESDFSSRVTKRVVLSEIAKLFDPIGFLCPVITLGKIFYQELWKLKSDWDTELPFELARKWKTFRSQLSHLKDIGVPRYVMFTSDSEAIELHGFSDASEKAYGACIYVLNPNVTGTVTSFLLIAKSKVAPTKTLTIARLELLGATLLADLMFRIKNEIFKNVPAEKIHYWTDSSIVLSWLAADPHNWTIFVSHRVAKIQELTAGSQWKHVPGTANPADLISRGMLPVDIVNSSLWWHGPRFLKLSKEQWPSEFEIREPREVSDERRRVKVSLLTTNEADVTDSMQFSVNYRGIRRAFAYAHRFMKNCRAAAAANGQRSLNLNSSHYRTIEVPTLEEEEEAERLFLAAIQKVGFPNDYRCLETKSTVPVTSKLKPLAPFLDEHHLIRVGGRLRHANLDYNSKHQILLPKEHRYTMAIISYYHHIRTFHAGPQLVLTAVRSRYWPINGLQLTRKLIRSCVWCFRMRPTFPNQLMGHLPKDRLGDEQVVPFSVTGVDFAGPFIVKHHMRCKVDKKMYAALFICFATKALHVELVPDLSEEAFIQALKRFVADRGGVKKMYSDNATNFRGASNYLKEVEKMLKRSKSVVEQALSADCISWSFIPPKTPTFGGLWEASVKLVKRLLFNIIGSHEPTEDQLRTYLKQVAAVINSRPITPLSSDPNDLAPLTPGHFLYGHAPVMIPENDVVNCRFNILKSAHKMLWMIQQFWTRYQKQYFCLVQSRYKWNKLQPSIIPGTMVLLKDNRLPPLKWSLGRITEVIPGKDGLTRVVKVKTNSGIYERGLNGIAVLPNVE